MSLKPLETRMSALRQIVTENKYVQLPSLIKCNVRCHDNQIYNNCYKGYKSYEN